MASLPIAAAGNSLLPLVYQKDVCEAVELYELEPYEVWWFLQIFVLLYLLSIVAFGMIGFWLRLKLHDEQRKVQQCTADLEKCKGYKELYYKRWQDTMDQVIALQFEHDQFGQRLEAARSNDAQTIRQAKGLLDRALQEAVDFREMHAFWTHAGRSWHCAPDCSALQNSVRVMNRPACTICFNTKVMPLKRHEHTGRTFAEDCREFFRHNGGHVSYIDTIMEWEPESLMWWVSDILYHFMICSEMFWYFAAVQ